MGAPQRKERYSGGRLVSRLGRLGASCLSTREGGGGLFERGWIWNCSVAGLTS